MVLPLTMRTGQLNWLWASRVNVGKVAFRGKFGSVPPRSAAPEALPSRTGPTTTPARTQLEGDLKVIL
jgi:hypothetical protein